MYNITILLLGVIKILSCEIFTPEVGSFMFAKLTEARQVKIP
jgi:hypothetical protein